MNELVTGDDGVPRCAWGASTPAYCTYHDEEWGRPTADDRWIFEKLCLEGFQSGLSWLTILNKRPAFRDAFANFEIDAMAAFDEADVERLLQNAGIVRHRRKIESAINNAQKAQALRAEFGSLAAYVWGFEAQGPGAFEGAADRPAKTAESTALSKDLKKRGWSFVGPTTMYAFMQAAGMVNDHAPGCAAGEACARTRSGFQRP